ncbi:MAG: hypothetical protein HOV81_00165 [Kofleriaceae bacterium]|nr:hypothetical protein [Kofleriaceae bacterium]
MTSLIPWLEPSRDFGAHVTALGAPHILCLQEVRVRPGDADAVARMRDRLPGYRCEFSLCNDPRNVKFRGGRAYGVATYTHDSLGTVVGATPAWDREGRVHVTALPDHGLAVVNLYAVNGTSKPYLDPDSGEPRGDRHAYKQRFQEQVFDLAGELRANASVILAGDWNVSRSALDVTPRLRTEEPHATARAKLNDRLAKDGWIDVLRHREPEARRYTWFGRTRTGALDAARVDYIVVSPDLLPRVIDASILDRREQRPGTDHAPLSLAIAR